MACQEDPKCVYTSISFACGHEVPANFLNFIEHDSTCGAPFDDLCDNTSMANKIANKNICWFCEIPEDEQLFRLDMEQKSVAEKIGSKNSIDLADHFSKLVLPYFNDGVNAPKTYVAILIAQHNTNQISRYAKMGDWETAKLSGIVGFDNAIADSAEGIVKEEGDSQNAKLAAVISTETLAHKTVKAIVVEEVQTDSKEGDRDFEEAKTIVIAVTETVIDNALKTTLVEEAQITDEEFEQDDLEEVEAQINSKEVETGDFEESKAIVITATETITENNIKTTVVEETMVKDEELEKDDLKEPNTTAITATETVINETIEVISVEEILVKHKKWHELDRARDSGIPKKSWKWSKTGLWLNLFLVLLLAAERGALTMYPDKDFELSLKAFSVTIALLVTADLMTTTETVANEPIEAISVEEILIKHKGWEELDGARDSGSLMKKSWK